MRKMVRSLLIIRRFRNWKNRLKRLRRMIGLGRRKGRGRKLKALSAALKDVRFFFLVSLWWDTHYVID
jgi:hypothetical protein